MNIQLIVALLTLPQAPVDHIGTVSIDRCWSSIDTAQERLHLKEAMTSTDADARIKLAEVKASEAALREDSTQSQHNNAKLLRAEFELSRLHIQQAFRSKEADMLNDAFRRVEKAVMTVARLKSCSIVLYQRKRVPADTLRFTAQQLIYGAPRSVVLSDADRIDITEDVLTLLSTDDGTDQLSK